jgi:hypothetical protein
MTKDEAIKIEKLVDEVADLAAYPEARKLLKDEIRRMLEAEAAKPYFFVGAYVPKGEDAPVLLPMWDDRCSGGATLLGPVARRSDPLFAKLLAACFGNPVWMYGQQPVKLC